MQMPYIQPALNDLKITSDVIHIQCFISSMNFIGKMQFNCQWKLIITIIIIIGVFGRISDIANF